MRYAERRKELKKGVKQEKEMFFFFFFRREESLFIKSYYLRPENDRSMKTVQKRYE